MTQTDAIEVLSAIANVSSSISEDLYFSVLDEMYSAIIAKLVENDIKHENMGNSTLYIDKEYFEVNKIKAYSNLSHYFGNFEETDKKIIILGNINTDSIVSVEEEDHICFQQYKNKIKDKISTNYYYLKKLIQLLSQQDITDYKDTVHDRYFFLSPECGKLEINEVGSNNLIEIAKTEINIYKTYKKFMEMNKYQKGWEFILKNKIIKGLEGTDIENEGFKELIINLEYFLDATIRDYELFLNTRKHESIVQHFENEKFIFADKIRAILQRISGSIISIPIAFIGAIVAIRDVSELWMINIIFLVMIVFIIFTSLMNILFWGELNIIKKEIDLKMDVISMGVARLHNNLKVIISPFYNRIILIKIIIFIIIAITISLLLYFYLKYNSVQMIINNNCVN